MAIRVIGIWSLSAPSSDGVNAGEEAEGGGEGFGGGDDAGVHRQIVFHNTEGVGVAPGVANGGGGRGNEGIPDLFNFK